MPVDTKKIMQGQYSFREVEEAIYREWEEKGYFTASRNPRKKPYCIVIPPPNITGILHMGHALNNTIQDVLIRYKRLCGYEVLWMPGTDHAGIATQNVVEKNLAKKQVTRESAGRKKFEEYLWDWTRTYGSTIITQLKRLGAHCDWSRLRFTMDEGYSEAVRAVFVSLYEKGLIYRGNYIINWCPRCRTALSDEEAPYKELDGWLYYIRYPITHTRGEGTPTAGVEKQDFVTVATTRPETMLGDTAVAYNPADTRYAHLKDATVLLPIMNRKLQVIQDPLVDPAFGTGVVKVTPAHDKNDFVMAKKHKVDCINIMNDDATINENAPVFKGLDRFAARAKVVEQLALEGLLVKKEPYKINAGHCYRCGTIVEPRLSLQWFVKMKSLSIPAVDAVKDGAITFSPKRWEKVYLNWMENIEDWCISRQIWWGHRLPVYYCRECTAEGKSKIKNQKSKIEDETVGVIVAKEKPPKCPYCGSQELVQDSDVLDTWFSSWLWPFATMGWPQKQKSGDGSIKSDLDYFYPTDTLVTASEILFFWVARMIMASLEFMDEIPFKDVLIHGTVRDAKGLKMSKSLGNTIDPLAVIEKYGADALRFSLMILAASGADVYLSEEKFVVGRNFANKVWNAFKYSLGVLAPAKETIAPDIPIAESVPAMSLEDYWILEELSCAAGAYRAALESYKISEAVKVLYEFFWHKFCDWYIEISKVSSSSAAPRVIFFVFKELLKMLHPFMPFMSEYLWKKLRSTVAPSLPEPESILTGTFAELPPEGAYRSQQTTMRKLIDFVVTVRSIKKYLDIPASEKIYVEADADEAPARELLFKNRRWICLLARLSGLEPKQGTSVQVFSQGGFMIYFREEKEKIDRYRQSLSAKIEKMQEQEAHYKRKLSDENFVTRAPAELVQSQKDKYREILNDLAVLKKIGATLE